MTTATIDGATAARRTSSRRPGNPHVPVSTLVERAAGGDTHAWRELIERYRPLVASVARRHRLSPSDAEDVSQRVWLLLLTHVGRLRQPESLPGWLMTTTARECLRFLSRARRDAEVTASDLTESATAPGPDELVLERERSDAVRRALGRLSSHRRRVVEAVVLAEMPYAAAADHLGVPIGSLGPTRIRTLNALAKTPELAALS